MNRAVFAVIFLSTLVSAFIFNIPKACAATTPFEISGWIPYWREATGTIDVLPHMKSMTSVMPFGYIVQNDGALYDAFGFSATSSATSSVSILSSVAKIQKVKIIPTVMWSNSEAMDRILKNATTRQKLEDDIANLVKQNNFAGIDIDFENKLAETKSYFSLFLKGLYMRMGQKLVYCAIEPRTPPSSAFAVIPNPLQYANDYSAINKYCDRVEIMAYDQGRVDIKLNANASPTPYIPISDTAWVKKVVELTAQSISKKKIIIGIATYGYEYDLVKLTQGYRYDLAWTFNQGYATALASDLGLIPTRNSAGELNFIYTPTTTPMTNIVAASASAGPIPATTTPQRIVWWSDASSVNDKIQLAKQLGVRGVAFFKFDGGEDQNIWNILP